MSDEARDQRCDESKDRQNADDDDTPDGEPISFEPAPEDLPGAPPHDIRSDLGCLSRRLGLNNDFFRDLRQRELSLSSPLSERLPFREG